MAKGGFMNIVKYEHACFTVEKDGQQLVVDPGSFATDFIAPSGVVAVIITHEHPDHFDPEHIAAIFDKNPDAVVFAPDSVTAHIEAFASHPIKTGDVIQAGPFTLEFHGGRHAIIHESIPPIANLGVLINELIYYPGDAFTLTHKPIDTLALPIAAPWMKMAEAIDFLTTLKPRFAFPTHDKILSDEGKAIADRLLSSAAARQGITYQRIETTEV